MKVSLMVPPQPGNQRCLPMEKGPSDITLGTKEQGTQIKADVSLQL